MPQLDVTTYTSQIFWLIICFSLLYLILAFALLPQMSRIIARRTRTIEDFIHSANQLRKEAEKWEAKAAKEMTRAQEKSHLLYKEYERRIAKQREIIKIQLQEAWEQKLKTAEKSIQQEEQKIRDNLASVSTQLTQTILHKLTGHEFSSEAIGKIQEKKA